MSTAILAIGAALAGCADSTPPPPGPVPSFSGPWAAEFAEAYRSTTSATVHEILAKGSITDEDYALVSRGYVSCMRTKGFTAKVTGPSGEGTVEGHGDPAAANEECSGDLSVIAALRSVIAAR